MVDYIADDAKSIAERIAEIERDEKTCPECKLYVGGCRYCSKQPCAMGFPPVPEQQDGDWRTAIGYDLDKIAARYDLTRGPGEDDFYLRNKIKTHLLGPSGKGY